MHPFVGGAQNVAVVKVARTQYSVSVMVTLWHMQVVPWPACLHLECDLQSMQHALAAKCMMLCPRMQVALQQHW